MESLPDFCKELLVQSMKGMKMKSLGEKEPQDESSIDLRNRGRLTKEEEEIIREAWNKTHPRDFNYAGNHWRKARSGTAYGPSEFRKGYIVAKRWDA